MRVLITGGAGFIGRRLAFGLAERGIDVTIFDIHLGKKKKAIEIVRDKVSIIEGSVGDKKIVYEATNNIDVVVHLAAGASFLMYEQHPLFETVNVMEGFLNVLEAVKKCRVRKLIYTSSSAVYEGNPLPYR